MFKKLLVNIFFFIFFIGGLPLIIVAYFVDVLGDAYDLANCKLEYLRRRIKL